MKKKNSKAKVVSEPKKQKEALTEKLIVAFTAVIADYGKVKKSKAIIEKFAKQLIKNIDLKSEPILPVEAVEEVEEKPVAKVKPAKKAAIKTAE